MKLSAIISGAGLEVRGKASRLDTEITGAYAGDLLSDVLAHGREDGIWITLQLHPNIVAVASMKRIAAIIIINGREPAAETVAKADEENIAILVSSLPAFELSGRLYAMGVPGSSGDADGA